MIQKRQWNKKAKRIVSFRNRGGVIDYVNKL